MFSLKKVGFDISKVISNGNMFLIGNGHLGYRGTLEEYSSKEMVGLNVVGVYDKYLDKWRESINMPNPFFLKMEEYNIFNNNHLNHYVELDIKHALFKRHTEYSDLTIDSERFISQTVDNIILFKYTIKTKKNIKTIINLGTDINIYEINGPHFKDVSFNNIDNKVSFKGITNENKLLCEEAIYLFPKEIKVLGYSQGLYTLELDAKENSEINIYCKAKIYEHDIDEILKFDINDYNKLKEEHFKEFEKKWDKSDIIIKGNDDAQFAIRYSIYHLLILGNKNHVTSIPARGVSGQTYKGAIFWDTEIFLLPFFTMVDLDISKNLLKYRVNTLNGALDKAKEYGYQGAFYAWESQEYGQDGCSKYNVTDSITNEPIRTYFNEKQIHISFDIAYAVFQYLRITNDYSLLDDKTINMLVEIVNFAISYSTLIDNKYHLNDVIGPDEYHERVDDNAFTNYMVRYVVKEVIEVIKKEEKYNNLVNKYQNYLDNLYVPEINEEGLIEQFRNYYNLEDVSVDTVRSRLRHPLDYWGTENGVAYPTRVIKQADVITLLVLLGNDFSLDYKKKNFDFYYPYTEHGSSLSSSMYSIIASLIGYSDIAYEMFMKSATIDLGENQKMFAGGIYIGGTHPASNGGAYLSLVYGMAGLLFKDDKIELNPHLPKEIKGLEFKVTYKSKEYLIIINEDNSYIVRDLYD